MNNALLTDYHTVFVISDLHLGGYEAPYEGQQRDYRIFRDGEALAWFIGHAAASRTAGGRIALVINGDLVDFLAVEDATYFDWEGADGKLTAIIDDPQLGEMWTALTAFVQSDRGDLIIVLGNHDLELALPGPQQLLLTRLAGRDAAKRARVIFAMDGCGFSCRVGGKRVLCVHGNEVDPWNAIEWGRLAFIRRALTRGSLARDRQLMDDWIPNPGTQLVIDHLNGVKRQHQWIDLLKPEEESAAMVAAAIARRPAIRTFAEVLIDKQRIQKRLAQGFMGGAPRREEPPPLPIVRGPAPPHEVRTLLTSAAQSVSRGERAVDLVDPGDEFLMRTRDQILKAITLKLWPSSLRSVLESTLADDRTFDITTADDTFRELDAICSPAIDFLVAGHTHLQRALPRAYAPGAYYFNSGTWIRLARIPSHLLAPGSFPAVEARLRDGSMQELEKGPPLISETRTVVKITIDATEGARGALHTVERTANGWTLTEVPQSARPARAKGGRR